MLNYNIAAENGSMYNTPPCWPIYVCGLVFQYLLKLGGLQGELVFSHSCGKRMKFYCLLCVYGLVFQHLLKLGGLQGELVDQVANMWFCCLLYGQLLHGFQSVWEGWRVSCNVVVWWYLVCCFVCGLVFQHLLKLGGLQGELASSLKHQLLRVHMMEPSLQWGQQRLLCTMPTPCLLADCIATTAVCYYYNRVRCVLCFHLSYAAACERNVEKAPLLYDTIADLVCFPLLAYLSMQLRVSAT
jgi:hypothetical protein